MICWGSRGGRRGGGGWLGGGGWGGRGDLQEKRIHAVHSETFVRTPATDSCYCKHIDADAKHNWVQRWDLQSRIRGTETHVNNTNARLTGLCKMKDPV